MINYIKPKSKIIYNSIIYVLKTPMSARTCADCLGFTTKEIEHYINFLLLHGYIKKLKKRVENRQLSYQYKSIVEDIESIVKNVESIRKKKIMDDNFKPKKVIINGHIRTYNLSYY